ncbi:hypothetical protein ABBQ32_011556 [Trebouxia sp. C0010 RCD-2024]
MQLFLRQAGAQSTHVVQAEPHDCFQSLMDRLASSSTAASSGEVIFESQGRTWPRETSLATAGVQAGDFIALYQRLRGGGGDGGSTGAESRSSFLEMYAKKKVAKVNPVEAKLAKWTRCNLSGEVLHPPCVADELGNLYNKDAMVQALVTKSLPASLSYISSLKHLVDLRLTRNENADKAVNITTQGNFQPSNEAQFVCPITGQELNGRFRFSVLKCTGHVISERALKQIPQAVEEHVGQKWTSEDVVPLNGTVDEVEQLRDAMLARRAAIKAKKGKKAAKAVAAGLSEADKLVVSSNAAKERSQVTSAAQAADLAAAVAAEVQARLASNGGKRRAGGAGDETVAPMSEQEKALIKKFKASDRVPAHASKSVYSSIFMSSRQGGEKESYTCRSTSARGMNMT